MFRPLDNIHTSNFLAVTLNSLNASCWYEEKAPNSIPRPRVWGVAKTGNSN
jgi:hypothetical protein